MPLLDRPMSPETKEVFEKAHEVWNPNRIEFFENYGAHIVMGERSGSRFKDLDGYTYINMHSNGGVFNLGHKNPEVAQALKDAVDKVDAGNHYFPSPYKNAFCEELLKVSPDNMRYVVPLNTGSESIDAAIKFARFATKRKRVVSVKNAFHGATGASMQAGNPKLGAYFNMTPDEKYYTHIPYNDLKALKKVLKKGDTAAVVLETLPATAGFPIPDEGYHKGVEELCHKYGALYIADEVQCGLMRSGKMWCVQQFGAKPDMIVTAKGLSGGYYPMAAVIMDDAAAAWMKDDGFAHTTSFNGCEVGCITALKVLEILQRPETKKNVDMLTDFFAEELPKVQAKHPYFFTGIRQVGVIMGLETCFSKGAYPLMFAMIKNGVWCVAADFDKSVLQFKPNLLMDLDTAKEVIEILDKSCDDAWDMIPKKHQIVLKAKSKLGK